MAENEESGTLFKTKPAEWISAKRERRRAKNLARRIASRDHDRDRYTRVPDVAN